MFIFMFLLVFAAGVGGGYFYARKKNTYQSVEAAINCLLETADADYCLVLTVALETVTDDVRTVQRKRYGIMADEQTNVENELNVAYFSLFPHMLAIPANNAVHIATLSPHEITLNYTKDEVKQGLNAIQGSGYAGEAAVVDILLDALNRY